MTREYRTYLKRLSAIRMRNMSLTECSDFMTVLPELCLSSLAKFVALDLGKNTGKALLVTCEHLKGCKLVFICNKTRIFFAPGKQLHNIYVRNKINSSNLYCFSCFCNCQN